MNIILVIGYICSVFGKLGYKIQKSGYFRMNGVMPLRDLERYIERITLRLNDGNLTQTKEEFLDLDYDYVLDFVHGIVDYEIVKTIGGCYGSDNLSTSIIVKYKHQNDSEEHKIDINNIDKLINSYNFKLDKKQLLKLSIIDLIEQFLQPKLSVLDNDLFYANFFYEELEKKVGNQNFHYFESLRRCFEYLHNHIKDFASKPGCEIFERIIRRNISVSGVDIDLMDENIFFETWKIITDLKNLIKAIIAVQNNDPINFEALRYNEDIQVNFYRTVAINLLDEKDKTIIISREKLYVKLLNEK
ncbi:hypothetical protein NGRA_3477, partial [Nosema granulosis]